MPRRAAPDPEAAAIGARIRALREEQDMGLEKLANAVEPDYSKGHLSNLERGYVMPTIATLRRIARALGVHVADLVIDPDGSDREKVFALTRSIPDATLKRLAKDLAVLSAKKRRRKSASPT